LPFGTECGGKYCQYIGNFMMKWSGDIENYCNILPIFPPHSVPKGKGIILLAIFYCQGMLLPKRNISYILNNSIVIMSNTINMNTRKSIKFITKMDTDLIALPIELMEIIFETANINPIVSKWWFDKLKTRCAEKYLRLHIKMAQEKKDDIYATTGKMLGINAYTMEYWCWIREPLFCYSRDSLFEYVGKHLHTQLYVNEDLRLSAYDNNKNSRHNKVVRSALSLGTIKSLLNSETKAIPFDTKVIKYSIMLDEINKQLSGEFIWQLAYLTVSSESLGIQTQIRPSNEVGPIYTGFSEEAERLLNCIKENLIKDTRSTE
jgi:hypothetical protein